MRNRRSITFADRERLERLIARLHAESVREGERLEMLRRELECADVVDSETIPHDVVTMNSEIRLKDLDTERVDRYKLVFPHQFRCDYSISVLAPIGIAILGQRVGDVIEEPGVLGGRRWKVYQILYQPEAAGAIETEC